MSVQTLLKNPLWILICGRIRNPLEFNSIIYLSTSLREKGIIEGIVLSTWNDEIDKYPNLRKRIVEQGIIICETQPLSNDQVSLFRSTYVPQAIQVQVGLNSIPNDVFVLKCRTDRSCGDVVRILNRLNYQNLEICSQNVINEDQQYKVGVLGPSMPCPFGMRDFAFIGWKKDIQKMILTETKYYLGHNITPEISFFTGWYFHRFDIMIDCFSMIDNGYIWSIMEEYGVWINKIKKIPQLILKLYAFYFASLKSCFYIIDGDNKDIISLDLLLKSTTCEKPHFINGSLNQSIVDSLCQGKYHDDDIFAKGIASLLSKFLKNGNVNVFYLSPSDVMEFYDFLTHTRVDQKQFNIFHEPVKIYDSPKSIFKNENESVSDTIISSFDALISSEQYYMELNKQLQMFRFHSVTLYEQALCALAAVKYTNDASIILARRLYLNRISVDNTSIANAVFQFNGWKMNSFFNEGWSSNSILVNYYITNYCLIHDDDRHYRALSIRLKGSVMEGTDPRYWLDCHYLADYSIQQKEIIVSAIEKLVILLTKYNEESNLISYLDAIVSYAQLDDNNARNALNIYYDKPQDSFIQSYAYHFLILSKRGATWAQCDYIKILWKQKNPNYWTIMFNYAITLPNNNPEIYGWLSRCYREGRGIEKNLIIAAKWMRKACEGGVKWADWELFDILWRINTPESMSEAVGFVMPLAESGVRELQGWIARCYREGKGVEKDLDKAAEWMRKACNQKLWYASWELFDILWLIDTPVSVKEAISIAEPLAQSGNRELQGRMGRAYRDGKGVVKDLNLAMEWFEKAADQNLAWAKKELADLDNRQA